MKRIHQDWKRFYENDTIIDRPILEMTTLELKNWARNKIIQGNLTKKIYYNMTVIIRQSLDYLVELGELSANPFSNFKIKSSLFTPVVAKESEYEVFNEVEEQQIKALALELFEKVKEDNLKHGYSCKPEDYIFLYRGNRISSKSIANKYEKYCKALGIIKKTNHKARKTCLTKIADNANINLKDAMEFG